MTSDRPQTCQERSSATTPPTVDSARWYRDDSQTLRPNQSCSTAWALFGIVLALVYYSGEVGHCMSEKTEETPKHTNHLIEETSPYLLQHAHNPVDWYPWEKEALEKAQSEDKPIFLSIGYSACHWCHVMEHESFENEAIAEFLNEHFVCIKVDREERPDLDEIYMTATQMISGSGGWPMTVFLTPDLKPFYAGTYFPPDARYGRPGFTQILTALADAYENRREEVLRNAENVTRTIQGYLAADASSATLSEKIISDSVESMKNRFDPVYGGFGGAPKFPHTMDLMLLMRHYQETGDDESLRMTTESLDKMARGGMYDQLGGGFHRYSVDAEWLIPHFEKMLYDNALLARTYLEGFQLTGNKQFEVVGREILDYVVREMQSSEGGYFSSTDADSEGEEGKFFVWTPQEIQEILGDKDARIFCEFYDVREGGNFEHGTSALSIPKATPEVAEGLGMSVEEVNEVINRSQPKLLEVRAQRIAPGLDDKVLVDWNGLMISAMAFGGFVLEEPRYIDSAQQAAEALLAHQWNGDRLLHTRRNGKSHLEGMLSDYANLAYGLIDLFLATQESKWLESALEIHKKMVDLFWDSEEGGFFNTLDEQADLIIRTKSGTDNAVPSGNSIATLNAIRLSSMTGDLDLEKQAEKTLLAFGESLKKQAMAYPMMLNALHYFERGGEELLIVSAEEQGFGSFVQPLRTTFAPRLVWMDVTDERIGKLNPLAADRKAVDGKPTGYLCRNRACQSPTTDPMDILKEIK